MRNANDATRGVEFRIMPSGEARWYWEIVTEGPRVIARGLADTELEARQQANDAARTRKLIE